MRIDFLQVCTWCEPDLPHIIIREQRYVVELCMYRRQPNTQKNNYNWSIRKGPHKDDFNDFISGDVVSQPGLVQWLSRHLVHIPAFAVFSEHVCFYRWEKRNWEIKCLPKVAACKCWSWNLNLGHLAPNFMFLTLTLCYVSKEPFHSNVLQEALFVLICLLYATL